jgi:hypothetical protein
VSSLLDLCSSKELRDNYREEQYEHLSQFMGGPISPLIEMVNRSEDDGIVSIMISNFIELISANVVGGPNVYHYIKYCMG